MRIAIIIGSTRPGRNGLAVAQWAYGLAKQRTSAEYELVDIVDYNLPLFDEAVPPAMGPGSKEHTKKWAAKIASFDGYVFVTPEYNYCPPPSLVNALDYVYREWNYKPCGFVSYGGVSGGLRAVQAAKLQVTTLKLMPMMEGVMVPMVASLIDEAGQFQSNALIDKSALTLLDELRYWADGLKAMRDKGRG